MPSIIEERLEQLNIYAARVKDKVNSYKSGTSQKEVIDDLETYVKSMSFIVKVLKSKSRQ